MSKVPSTLDSAGSRGKRTRTRILEAAEEVVGRRGFHDASIAEITKLAGVAQGSFYIYFPSKTSIFEELVRVRGRDLLRVVRAAVELHEDWERRQRAGIRAYFGWIAAHPWLFRAIRQAEFVDEELRDEWYRGIADMYAASLTRGVTQGQISVADPELLTWCVIGMLDCTAIRWIILGNENPLTEAHFEEFVAITLRAVGKLPSAT